MTTRTAILMGLVGTGVTPSLTPPMHVREGWEQGLALVYRPIDLTALGIAPEALPDILDWAERLGFDALNITHPCKRSVIPLLDRLDPVAAALGAVNTVLFTPEGRIGHNTDTSGFALAFSEGLAEAATGQVVQLGAGGAGSAVADALLRLGAEELVIVEVAAERARVLAEDLTARHGRAVRVAAPQELDSLLVTSDGVVNCTPVGMHDHPGLPLDAALLQPRHWVADIVYRPLDTALLRAAREVGCRTLHGGHMAVAQAADTFRLVTGRAADLGRMQRHFYSLIDEEAGALA